MEFFFYPADENQFKQAAVGNFVRTLVFDTNKNEVVVTVKKQRVGPLEQGIGPAFSLDVVDCAEAAVAAVHHSVVHRGHGKVGGV